MLGAIVFGGARGEELAAALGHIRQPLLLGRNCGRGRGFEGGAVIRQDGGINGVGFGALALGAGEVPDAARFNDAHRDVGRLKGAHDALFVTPGVFANDLRAGMRPEEFEELSVTLGVIAQGVKTACEVELQRELGNI